MSIEQSNDRMQILTPSHEPKKAYIEWIMDQLTILAEVFEGTNTAAKLRLYATDLQDISQDFLETAFVRARRELRFFPKIAELRELAGLGDADVDQAWEWITSYISRHGAEGRTRYEFSNPSQVLLTDSPQTLSNYIRGLKEQKEMQYRRQFKSDNPDVSWPDCPAPENVEIPYTVTRAPQIPDAIAYAVRQLGFDFEDGLQRIKNTKDDPSTAGFVRKEFAQAYKRGLTSRQYPLLALTLESRIAPSLPLPPADGGSSASKS